MGQLLSSLQKNVVSDDETGTRTEGMPGDRKTPPVSRHFLATDPRSPSQAIPRTPIEVTEGSASLDLRRKLVRRANKQMNPFKSCGTLLPTVINGESFSYMFAWSSRLPKEQLEWMFTLSNDNMGSFYELSGYQYNPVDKRRELRTPTSRYIIVKNSSSMAIGYCHYQFDVYNGFAVLYCYEIQVDKEYQSKGIGTALLSILQLLAKRALMDKIVVKVFGSNDGSLSFFYKLGFSSDGPCSDPEQDQDFLILSKSLL